MALNWRDVTLLDLDGKLIPNPNASSQLLNRLHNVRVAVEGGFLHVDPRPADQRDQGGEYDVFLIPANAVLSVVYRVTEPAQTMIDVQVG